ncbi:MAG: ThuA domain-containing protein [Thermoguttaceae bacterium]
MSILRSVRAAVVCGAVVICLCWSLSVARSEEAWTAPVIHIVADRVTVTPEQRRLIEDASPAEAVVTPKKNRRLLIFDVNADYGGHGAIPYANLAFELMGKKTGAFEAVVSRDPQVFAEESLRTFDAIFFNNNVGNIFTDATLRQNVERFVKNGGGIMGVHGTTAAFMNWAGPNAGTDDWPAFGEMIGGRGTNHREGDEKIFVAVEDPQHPLTQHFPRDGFPYQDEFFRVSPPYSREKQRVLLRIDNVKSNLNREPYAGHKERADEDYALAWVKEYGNGRCFYSTFAHSPKIFWDPAMLRFYLAATQFVLGDLDAPTLPSAQVTPDILNHEKLGWKLAIPAYTFHKFTLAEMLDKVQTLGVPYIGGLSFQKVGGGIDKMFDPTVLTDDEIDTIAGWLREKNLRMLSCYYHTIPGDEAACRKLFDFAKKLGIKVFLSEPDPADLAAIEKLCEEYDIHVAIHNHALKDSPHYAAPQKLLNLIKDRSPYIGACVDMGYWMRDGIDPIEGIRILKDRVKVVQVHDLNNRNVEGVDVVWGTGTGATQAFLEEMHKLGLRNVIFDVEFVDHEKWLNNLDECKRCIEFFNDVSAQLE